MGETDLISGGIEEDDDVRAALAWFAAVSGDPQAFIERLARAQQAYRTATASPQNRGQDPQLDLVTHDVVGAFLAQAKSLLDDRRSYDIALASQIVPWIKQIGRNINVIARIPGAIERATRMLGAEGVDPDSALLELVMASNYSTQGFDVALLEEASGKARTPDLRLFAPGSSEPIFVECKRLKRGRYELQEKVEHRRRFLKLEELIYDRRLSVHLDVTYTRQLSEVPDHYLADRLLCALSNPINTPNAYQWRDGFGFGVVTSANLAAVRRDIRDSSLYFGTKLARLLSGYGVREGAYHLAVRADPDDRDPRFIDSIYHGSVVTWQCIAPAALQKKARYVRAKLAEADQQLMANGAGVAHLAMDMELRCESSDLRRARNIEVITTFHPRSDLLAIYLHYLVPRISESHSWLVDETVDRFGQGYDPLPFQMIFPSSATICNDLPAWKQSI